MTEWMALEFEVPRCNRCGCLMTPMTMLAWPHYMVISDCHCGMVSIIGFGGGEPPTQEFATHLAYLMARGALST